MSDKRPETSAEQLKEADEKGNRIEPPLDSSITKPTGWPRFTLTWRSGTHRKDFILGREPERNEN